MTQEVERCRSALAHAAAGKCVALISSGDAGVYGMAGLAIELAHAEKIRVAIEVVPGVTAASAAADLVVALYNPRSKKRVRQLEEAVEILRAARPGTTPVGIATAAGQAGQSIVVTDLDHLLGQQVGMQSVVIVGNSTTRILDGRMVTARGYSL
jgi:precorrin-3B C17-methyltransferase